MKLPTYQHRTPADLTPYWQALSLSVPSSVSSLSSVNSVVNP